MTNPVFCINCKHVQLADYSNQYKFKHARCLHPSLQRPGGFVSPHQEIRLPFCANENRDGDCAYFESANGSTSAKITPETSTCSLVAQILIAIFVSGAAFSLLFLYLRAAL